MGTERVEMRPAFNWTCPECGRDHFVRAVLYEPSDEELLEHGITPGGAEGGHYMTYPRTVGCDRCDMSFKTIGFPNHDEDE